MNKKVVAFGEIKLRLSTPDHLRFIQTVCTNTTAGEYPIWMLYPTRTGTPSTIIYGGAPFNDCVIYDSNNGPFFFSISAAPNGNQECTKLTENFSVINPNGASMNLGSLAHNIPIILTSLTSAPAITISTSVNVANTTEGSTVSPAKINVLQSGSLSIPVAAVYTLTSTASNMLDYAYDPGLIVFPKNTTSVTRSIYSNADGLTEGTETVISALNACSDI